MLIHNRKDSIGLPLLPESPAADPKSNVISRILWAVKQDCGLAPEDLHKVREKLHETMKQLQSTRGSNS